MDRFTIANDILDYIEKCGKTFWTTEIEIRKRIPCSSPEKEYYESPFQIGRGIKQLLDDGVFKKVSIRRYIIMDNKKIKHIEKTKMEYDELLVELKSDTDVLITKFFKELNVKILSKNRRYGSSSLKPFGLFNKLSRESKIEARIEDKLSRIKAMQDNKKSADYLDAVMDLCGYCALYYISLTNDEIK